MTYDYNNVVVKTKPASAALERDFVKSYLRIDPAEDSDNDLLDFLIEAVTATIDGPDGIGYAMLQQDWLYTLHNFPYGYNPIWLPGWPIQSVTSVKYLKGNVMTAMPQQDLRFVGNKRPAGIWPVKVFGSNVNKSYWPLDGDYVAGAIEIEYRLGHAQISDIPADLRKGMLMAVYDWYENRNDFMRKSGNALALPEGADKLIRQYADGLVQR